MSAFLGPIHFWLYSKIQLQEALIRKIAAEAESDESSADYHRFVSEESRPLDELIDTMNIHGWLQDRIHDAEGRYAALVRTVLETGGSREVGWNGLKKIAYSFGEEHALKAESHPQEAYRYFEDSFLNGMPCDHVNMLTEQGEDRVSWEQTQDLHAIFWTEEGLNPSLYTELRDEIMQGMLAKTGLTVCREDETHYTVGIGQKREAER